MRILDVRSSVEFGICHLPSSISKLLRENQELKTLTGPPQMYLYPNFSPTRPSVSQSFQRTTRQTYELFSYVAWVMTLSLLQTLYDLRFQWMIKVSLRFWPTTLSIWLVACEAGAGRWISISRYISVKRCLIFTVDFLPFILPPVSIIGYSAICDTA